MLTTMNVAIARHTASDSVKFPNREDAEDGACNKGHRDDDERDPSHDRRIHNAARLGLKFHNYIGIVSLHIRNYNKSILSPVSCLLSLVSCLQSPVSCLASSGARRLREYLFKYKSVLTQYAKNMTGHFAITISLLSGRTGRE
jgi:hypothetical protein